MNTIRALRRIAAAAAVLTSGLVGGATPAQGWTIAGFNAPTQSGLTLTSTMFTYYTPYSCMNYATPGPCVNGFLELQVHLDDRGWVTLGRADTPNRAATGGWIDKLMWQVVGTCMSAADPDTERTYRSYFEQKRHDQGSLYFTERLEMSDYFQCRV